MIISCFAGFRDHGRGLQCAVQRTVASNSTERMAPAATLRECRNAEHKVDCYRPAWYACESQAVSKRARRGRLHPYASSGPAPRRAGCPENPSTMRARRRDRHLHVGSRNLGNQAHLNCSHDRRRQLATIRDGQLPRQIAMTYWQKIVTRDAES